MPHTGLARTRARGRRWDHSLERSRPRTWPQGRSKPGMSGPVATISISRISPRWPTAYLAKVKSHTGDDLASVTVPQTSDRVLDSEPVRETAPGVAEHEEVHTTEHFVRILECNTWTSLAGTRWQQASSDRGTYIPHTALVVVSVESTNNSNVPPTVDVSRIRPGRANEEPIRTRLLRCAISCIVHRNLILVVNVALVLERWLRPRWARLPFTGVDGGNDISRQPLQRPKRIEVGIGVVFGQYRHSPPSVGIRVQVREQGFSTLRGIPAPQLGHDLVECIPALTKGRRERW
ncbi:hypothetical protein FKP32DRAFT_1053091 [Trametes sanguinea]|nr:hypothetical protein FKP32DRAFT_1053091 [Trametes sanguinea]